MELPPSTASRVTASSYQWGDGEWMAQRATVDVLRSPIAIYEVHLGSWARVPEEGNRPLTYREIAPKLIDHVRRNGFTHVEFLPLAEHPFTGSWGYQVSAYFAPTARYGTPDDLRYLIDECHRAGIGVIMDWVPAHFPKDDFALRLLRRHRALRARGSPPGRAPRVGHADLQLRPARGAELPRGQRAVLAARSSTWTGSGWMPSPPCSTSTTAGPEGQWVPNKYGGREDLDAVEFLKTLNATIAEEHPGCFTVAEESTSWPRVTGPVGEGGLGFTFKWNMGWMHDTLRYFGTGPGATGGITTSC